MHSLVFGRPISKLIYIMSKPLNPNNDFRWQYINHLVTERCTTVDISSDEASTRVHSLLTKLVDKGLSYLEQRVVDGYCSGLSKVDISNEGSLQRLMNGYIYIEDLLMQTYRNRMEEGISDTNRNQTHQDHPHDRTHKYIHQEILTQIRPEILENVSLDSSAIMDKMIEDKLMTEDERQSIIQEKTPRRRKEEFLLLMKGRLSYKTLVDNFIPAIEADHPHVANKIKMKTAEYLAVPSRIPMCAFCNMKDTIQVKHIAEDLHTRGVISSNLHEELRSSRTSNQSKWSKLLAEVSNRVLISESLQINFPNMYDLLKSENATSLECKCIDMRDLVLEGYSETTDRTLVPDVANLDDLESQLDPSEDGSSVSALEQMEVVMDGGRVQSTFDTFEIRQDNKQIGKKGGVIVSSVFSEIQVQFPEGALKSTVNVGLQTQVIAPELNVRHLYNAAATSPIVTIQPRCRKVHKPFTLTIPIPKMRLIKRDLRLLYSISDYGEPDVWEDITDAKPIRLDNDFVTFTSMVSARFWLIDCANKDVEEAAKISNALYNDSIVAVQKKKQDTQEKDKKGLIGSTDDTTGNTLERQENDAVNRTLENNLITRTVTFTELAKSTETLW